MKKSSLSDFVNALKLLDAKLGEAGISSIEIRAIGGFAMMYYGFRQDGYTIDIDSLTEDYDDEVVRLIKEVGKEIDIDEDWLNTDCATLDGFIDDLSKKIEWKETTYSFENIYLMIADVKGLIRSKAKAVHDGGLVPRTTDKKDLLAGLRYLEIFTIEELDMSVDYSFIKEDYGRCYDYLREIEKW